MELERFYGRESVLSLFKKRVHDLKDGYRQNIAFLGERYIGKSMILKKFINDFDDQDMILIYLDLENKDFNYFYRKFVGSILYDFSKIKGLPLSEDIQILCENVQTSLPQTVKTIRRIHSLVLHGKITEAYREILALPQLVTQESNCFCVLMFDEFHNLGDYAIKDVFQELGKQIMTQKRCLYIVTSSLPGIAKNILSEKLSLLFGDFEIMTIDSFNTETSREFVKFHLDEIKMGDSLCHFLIDFTAGHPLYLKLICRELVNLCAIHKQSEVFQPLLIQAIKNVLFDRWGVLSRHFDLTLSWLCSGKGNLMLANILSTLVDGKQRMRELAHHLEVKQGLITPKVNRLMELGIIFKNRNYYYVKDKLLKYWLKYVYKKRQTSIDLDPEKQKNQFTEELTRAIDNFKLISQKDLSSRIIELFYCFDNDAFDINGRKYKLPIFKEVIPIKIRKTSGEYFDVIHATTSEGNWFIVLKPDMICENDIHAILMESKKIIQKPQRCILISLSNLDENARIRALQEKMWIWNEGELNMLMSLYDKPYIMGSVINC